MVLIIGGYPRSGTTLLQNLCNSHPKISVTMEFNNFAGLGKSFRGYSHQILKKWWHEKGRSFLVQGKNETQLAFVLKSYAFVARYLFELNRHRNQCINAATIEAALQNIFPKADIVGDKMPAYIFGLDNLVKIDGMFRVIVYRDCRDVTSSVLKMVRTKWRGRGFVKNLDTAEKIARRWVHAIELMEYYQDKLHIIRYENLVRKPEEELGVLGKLLGVDPGNFPKNTIQDCNIGKYKDWLSKEELAALINIAGPTMTRLGFLNGDGN